MLFRYLLLLILIPIKTFALIEVDITRGNLSPLPLAVSPLSIDEKSRKKKWLVYFRARKPKPSIVSHTVKQKNWTKKK